MGSIARSQRTIDVISTTAILATCVALVWFHWQRAPPEPEEEVALPVRAVPMGDGPTLGAATARVAIIEYSDYECPFCKRFERQTLPSLKTRYIDSGSVLLAFRHHPLESIHRFALTAAAAATCAGRQGRFWEYHAMLFDAPPRSLDNKKIFDLAKPTGLDEPTFTSCLGADVEASVRKDAASAIALGLKGTPAFLIGRIQDDGTLAVTAVLKGAQPLEAFTAAIDDALGRD